MTAAAEPPRPHAELRGDGAPPPGEGWQPLRRRGVTFGQVRSLPGSAPAPAAALANWRAAEPVFVPAALDKGLEQQREAITQTLRMFERLRRGQRFLDELELRLCDDEVLRYAGSTVDRNDPREIERVFVNAVTGYAPAVRDLWAKLSWIADDESDSSLRIRFSYGLDQHTDWLRATAEQREWLDQFAGRVFPECAAVLESPTLQAQLRNVLGQPFACRERIIYNNAPGGGAVFHHDADPGQLGVVYSQLAGETAWLALSKSRLAELLVAAEAATDATQAMRDLDLCLQAHHETSDTPAAQQLWQLLNRDPAFTARLARAGALYVLQAGDSILLPSHDIDRVAWHSVIALGRRPSLGHSYALDAADEAADEKACRTDPGG
ncbi:MAG: hypothetical protein VYE77_10330 [Planctomycetota bacterium]|nr:hypothetical protein [Planctomycetota bacterium]